MKSNVFFVQSKKMGQFIKIESDQAGIAEITYMPKSAMRSTTGHRIDYNNGVGALRGQRLIPSKY